MQRKLSKAELDPYGFVPVYSSESTNNGIIGYTNQRPEFLINKENHVYVVFGDHTRSFNIAKSSFCVADNTKVLRVKNHKISDKSLMFISSSWKKNIPDKGYSRHWSIAQRVAFKLPIKGGKPDFAFMENFIEELEAKRIAELEAYLEVTGLSDCELTEQEIQIINNLESVEWGDFRIGELFEKIKTRKLPFKADQLPKIRTENYTIPCLTSSFKNQGLNYFAPPEDATILKNVISIPSNSDVYRAYYQSKEFTVLSDAYAIRWALTKDNLSHNQYLFAVQCINKITDLHIYSYKSKLGGWNIVKDKRIKLPLKNEEIDFDFMEGFISAIQKIAIKDVVEYVDTKTQAHKEVSDS